MQQFIFILAMSVTLVFLKHEHVSLSSINVLQDTAKKQTAPNKKISKEEKWKSFWKDFTEAMYAKDKKKVMELASKDFYDGGGGTVDYWLDSEVFINAKSFNKFKATIKKGAKNFTDSGSSYKATGRNSSGDLFFEYKDGKWLLGGVVGD